MTDPRIHEEERMTRLPDLQCPCPSEECQSGTSNPSGWGGRRVRHFFCLCGQPECNVTLFQQGDDMTVTFPVCCGLAGWTLKHRLFGIFEGLKALITGEMVFVPDVELKEEDATEILKLDIPWLGSLASRGGSAHFTDEIVIRRAFPAFLLRGCAFGMICLTRQEGVWSADLSAERFCCSVPVRSIRR